MDIGDEATSTITTVDIDGANIVTTSSTTQALGIEPINIDSSAAVINVISEETATGTSPEPQNGTSSVSADIDDAHQIITAPF